MRRPIPPPTTGPKTNRGQFREFVEDTGFKTDAETDGKGGYGYDEDKRLLQAPEFLWNTKLGFTTEQTDDYPVVNISWNDAVAFCEWLSNKEKVAYRLPSEAEWEFACRAGNPSQLDFGDDEARLAEYAWVWYGPKDGKSTKPIGQKLPNALGLFDLNGNVWEWCRDSFAPYKAKPAIDPFGSGIVMRSLRGGGFNSAPTSSRCAGRLSYRPETRYDSIGFRIVRTFEKYEPKKPEAEGPAVAPNPGESSGFEKPETTESEKTLKQE